MFQEIITVFGTFRFRKFPADPVKIEAQVRKLTHLGSVHALRLSRDQEFRTRMKFGAISEEEQNRIFNELVVTNLMLLLLMLDLFEMKPYFL